MNYLLLTRSTFKYAVFTRDNGKCVNCGLPGQDAHHIIERRLFPDGGYYIENGATVCGTCHLAAESTLLDCGTLRAKAGIGCVVLPPHLYPDQEYDKWSNPILANGQRLQGELFNDESVQRALAPVLHLFTKMVKYPRTWHLPWSPGATDDDRKLTTTDHWIGKQVIITEKMDGENTTLYRDGIHARSLDYSPHPSRNRVKALWGRIRADIPDNYRICGENLTAKHSIRYHDLLSYLLVFGIWDGLTCLSWEETLEWSGLLQLSTVPVLYWGEYDPEHCKRLCKELSPSVQEGLVVRPAGQFNLREFKDVVGKYVRPNHVQTHGHWMREKLEFNVVTN